MRKSAALLAAALALALGPAPARAAPEPVIVVVESRGQMVEIPRRFATIFVADPGIASLQVIADDRFFVLGHSEGLTTLIALDGDGRVVYQGAVSVLRSLRSLQAMLRSAPPSPASATSAAVE